MKLKCIVPLVIFVVTIFSGNLSVALAQDVSPISQNQLNSQSSGPWAVSWAGAAGATFSEDGTTSAYIGQPLILGIFSGLVWNVSVSFNSSLQQASFIATTTPSYFNWNTIVPLGTTDLLYQIDLAVNYIGTGGGESIGVDNVSINDIPVSGSLTANNSQIFDGLTISSANPINFLTYTLTVASTTGWNNAVPSVMDQIAVPGPVPEPGAFSLVFAGGLVMLMRSGKLRKK